MQNDDYLKRRERTHAASIISKKFEKEIEIEDIRQKISSLLSFFLSFFL